MISRRYSLAFFIASCYLLITIVGKAQADTYISGRLGSGVQSDTITLHLHKEFSSSSGTVYVKDTLEMTSTTGRFHFKLPAISKPTYITLSTSARMYRRMGIFLREPVFREYLIMPGDSIIVQSNLTMNKFSGRGGERMQVWQEIHRNEQYRYFDLPSTEFVRTLEDRKTFCLNRDSLLGINLTDLEKHRYLLSVEDYKLLKTDVIGRNRSYLYRLMCTGFLTGIYDGDTAARDSMIVFYGNRYVKDKLDTDSVSIGATSFHYVNYAYYKILADYYYKRAANQLSVQERQAFERDDYFSLVPANKVPGILREKILVFWMLRNTASTIINDQQLENILSVLTTDSYHQMAIAIKNTFGTGMPVNDFTFTDRNGKPVRLSDFKGKLVLIDMWFTGCTGCVQVAKGLKVVEKALEGNKEVVFISLSIDKLKEKWLRSIDPDKSVQPGIPGYSYTHYTTPNTVYLYTDGTGSNNAFIQQYVPTNTYPHLLLVGKDQKVYSGNPPMPFNEKGEQRLIALMKKGAK